MITEWHMFMDDERLQARFEFGLGRVFLHTVFRKRIAGMRAARERFPDVLLILRELGYKTVNVVIPEGDAMLYKFERRFGFEEQRRFGGYILMQRET